MSRKRMLACAILKEAAREQSDQEALRDMFQRWQRMVGCSEPTDIEEFEEEEAVFRLMRQDQAKPGKRAAKLPELQLEVTDLSVRTFLQFWNQFELIHHDPTLTAEEKYRYLISTLKPHTEARKMVEGYPPTARNYENVIHALRKRYGRESDLIELYTNEIMQLATKRHASIKMLYEELSCRLRALETLGVKESELSRVLYPTLRRVLPNEIAKKWELRLFDLRNADDTYDPLSKFLLFLEREAYAEERTATLPKCTEKPVYVAQERKREEKPATACALTAEGLTSSQKSTTKEKKQQEAEKCVFCDGEHESHACKLQLTSEERLERVKEKGNCFICLKKGHRARFCRKAKDIKCSVCERRHYAIVCRGKPQEAVGMCCTALKSKATLPTLHVRVKVGERRKTIVALVDTGSDRTYIAKNIVQELEMPAEENSECEMIHQVFGGKTEKVIHYRYVFNVESLDGGFETQCLAYDQETICNLHVRPISDSQKELLGQHGVKLFEEETTGKVDLLIGTDFLPTIMEESMKLSEDAVATRTKLGWTVWGSWDDRTTPACSAVTQPNLSDLWALDVLGIKEPIAQKKREEEDEQVRQGFLKTITVDNNRFVVQLPKKDAICDISSNFNLAEKRLRQTVSKLEKTGRLQEYEKVFQQWRRDCIIEEIPVEPSQGHFLPHLPVIRDASITFKVRPVFDASAKDPKGLSLNMCLERGPNLIEKIPPLLMQFRQKEVGVTADIKQAFLQIEVNEADRDYLRFLWQEDGKTIAYRHRRVVFGLVCSPFLLEATLAYHLKTVAKNNAEKEACDAMSKAFYVDNLVMSVSSRDNAETFKCMARSLLADKNFDLRGWRISGEKTDEPAEMKLLGLLWNVEEDRLSVNMDCLINRPLKQITKKGILSMAHRLFDPIGYTCAFGLIPKLLLREVNSLKWQEVVPDEIAHKFQKWFKNCQRIGDISIPRFQGHVQSIHTFCDASKEGYAACVFGRSSDGSLSLLQARARVAPANAATIPRLELLGALLAARLTKTVKDALFLNETATTYWTDSAVTLSWLKHRQRWGIFVENRVIEILKLSSVEQWRHVPGDLNPADVPSRGHCGENLKGLNWWEGPQWLTKPEDDWPKRKDDEEDAVTLEVCAEIRRTANIKTQQPFSSQLTDSDGYQGSFRKLTRVMAWVLRVAGKIKGQEYNRYLTGEELAAAEEKLIAVAQAECFEEDNTVGGLRIFVDDKGLRRIKTRVTSEHEEFVQFPILLDGKHKLVKMIINEKHKEMQHAGVGTVAAQLRERFWIIRCRQATRTVVKKCVICQKLKTKPCSTVEGVLPHERTVLKYPFQTTGVDLAGPMTLRDGSKVWVVLFTCAVTRGVHLEITTSLATEDLLLAMRRMFARRGRPETIFSDNGTNLVGAANLLNRGGDPIKWIRIPPNAPWWGGFWERMVRIMKDLLKKVLGKARVTFEEFVTLLCECENVINARPLTYDGEEELNVLTPNVFLRTPWAGDADLEGEETLRKRAIHVRRLREHLKARFIKEYTAQLRVKENRTKGDKNGLRVGDIVLIHDKDKKRLEWRLGRVTELKSSRDGHERVATLKTEQGLLIRPVQRLCRLEMKMDDDVGEEPEAQFTGDDSTTDFSMADEPNDQTQTENSFQGNQAVGRTAGGRMIRKPTRLDDFVLD